MEIWKHWSQEDWDNYYASLAEHYISEDEEVLADLYDEINSKEWVNYEC